VHVVLEQSVGDDDVRSGQLLAAGNPLADDLAVVGDDLEVEAGDADARVAVAERGPTDVAESAPEGEVAALDRVLERRAIDGLGEREGERRVALELGQPEGRPQRADDGPIRSARMSCE
jgi:hypothetical protein